VLSFGAHAVALVRPTYACRSCESQGHDPQIDRAVLPQEPIPKSGIGAGLLAHVIVSKICDHLPLHRQESILSRHGWDVCSSTLCDQLFRQRDATSAQPLVVSARCARSSRSPISRRRLERSPPDAWAIRQA
jgi:transposase